LIENYKKSDEDFKDEDFNSIDDKNLNLADYASIYKRTNIVLEYISENAANDLINNDFLKKLALILLEHSIIYVFNSRICSLEVISNFENYELFINVRKDQKDELKKNNWPFLFGK
jgi:hypothetical protein